MVKSKASRRRRTRRTTRSKRSKRTTRSKKRSRRRRTKRSKRSKKRKNSKRQKQKGGNKGFYVDSPHVIELVSNDFNGSAISHEKTNGKPGVVMMYAHWCPHCSNADTINSFNKVGSMIKPEGGWFGAFDCAETSNGNKTKSDELGISAFPTVLFVGADGKLHV